MESTYNISALPSSKMVNPPDGLNQSHVHVISIQSLKIRIFFNLIELNFSSLVFASKHFCAFSFPTIFAKDSSVSPSKISSRFLNAASSISYDSFYFPFFIKFLYKSSCLHSILNAFSAFNNS